MDKSWKSSRFPFKRRGKKQFKILHVGVLFSSRIVHFCRKPINSTENSSRKVLACDEADCENWARLHGGACVQEGPLQL